MKIRIHIGRILGSVGKTLVTMAVSVAAQALADAAAKRVSRIDPPKP